MGDTCPWSEVAVIEVQGKFVAVDAKKSFEYFCDHAVNANVSMYGELDNFRSFFRIAWHAGSGIRHKNRFILRNVWGGRTVVVPRMLDSDMEMRLCGSGQALRDKCIECLEVLYTQPQRSESPPQWQDFIPRLVYKGVIFRCMRERVKGRLEASQEEATMALIDPEHRTRTWYQLATQSEDFSMTWPDSVFWRIRMTNEILNNIYIWMRCSTRWEICLGTMGVYGLPPDLDSSYRSFQMFVSHRTTSQDLPMARLEAVLALAREHNSAFMMELLMDVAVSCENTFSDNQGEHCVYPDAFIFVFIRMAQAIIDIDPNPRIWTGHVEGSLNLILPVMAPTIFYTYQYFFRKIVEGGEHEVHRAAAHGISSAILRNVIIRSGL
jgi:hypothetical protein